MNELEFFLLKLHLCNLDLKNELRVVRYMLSFERCPSKDELFLLLKLGQTQKMIYGMLYKVSNWRKRSAKI